MHSMKTMTRPINHFIAGVVLISFLTTPVGGIGGEFGFLSAPAQTARKDPAVQEAAIAEILRRDLASSVEFYSSINLLVGSLRDADGFVRAWNAEALSSLAGAGLIAPEEVKKQNLVAMLAAGLQNADGGLFTER